MAATRGAIDVFLGSDIAYAPGKAANAGGVATSQLAMAQNSRMQQWTMAQVGSRLHEIMSGIYSSCTEAAAEFGQPHNLVLGADVSAFRKVANAMIEQGVC